MRSPHHKNMLQAKLVCLLPSGIRMHLTQEKVNNWCLVLGSEIHGEPKCSPHSSPFKNRFILNVVQSCMRCSAFSSWWKRWGVAQKTCFWGGKPREGNTWYCCIFTGGRRDWQIYLSGVHQHISLLSVTYSTPLLSVSPAAEFPYLQLLPGKETSLWYRIWNEVKLKHQSVNLRISDHSLLNARCTDFFIAHQLCRCKGLNLLWSIW